MMATQEISTMPRRAYSYLRFSSKRQAHGDSQRRQEEFARIVCKEEGAILDDSLVLTDLGVPAFRGQNAQIGALAVFLEAIQSKRVCRGSLLILESIDRLSRNKVGQALQLFIGILNHGIEIVTAEPRRKYTAESINDIASILEPLIYMSRAHEESQTKSMRIRAAWGQKMKRARATKAPVWGSIPAWLRSTPEGLQIIPERAEIVRYIFKQACEGIGAFRITRDLNERGIPPLGRKGHWPLSSVKVILKSRSTFGEYQPGTKQEGGRRVFQGEPITNYYPPVIAEETFWAAQAAISGRRRRSGRPGVRETNLFTGIVFEAISKRTVHARPRIVNGHRYQYLTLAGEAWSFPYRPFQDCILEMIAQLKPREVIPSQATDNAHEDQIAAKTKQLFGLNHRANEVQREIENPDNAAIVSELTKSFRALALQKAEVVKELERLKMDSLTGHGETLAEVQSLIELLATAKEEELPSLRRRIKAALRRLVEDIYIVRQRVSARKCIVHVMLYLRSGGPRYGRVLPRGRSGRPLPGLCPWDLGTSDFRTGDIRGITSDAKLQPQFVG